LDFCSLPSRLLFCLSLAPAPPMSHTLSLHDALPIYAYGGPAGLNRLVDACHAAGLGVVLDVVYNHAGPVGNFLGEFGPYFTDRYRTTWGTSFNFDGAGSDYVRRFVVDNALIWIRGDH